MNRADGRAAWPEAERHQGAPLYEALLESRQRWRDMVTMAADFVYETDATGRLTFVAPQSVLGWPAEALTGRMADSLLAVPGGPNPFQPHDGFRGRRFWLKRADGGHACLLFSSAPLEECGPWIGCRGVAHDVTAQDAREAAVAHALRRGQVLEHVLAQMRTEILAPRMMQTVLEELAAATGAQGAVVMDLLAREATVLFGIGDHSEKLLPTILAMMADDGGGASPGAVSSRALTGHPVVACASATRFGERACLALWRAPDAEDWDLDGRILASSATAIIRVVLEHEAIQRELSRQARTDSLTGLLNRRSFLEDVRRRMTRLDRDELPGTLMFVDLDHFKALNDTFGHEVGDAALIATAALLRDTVRSIDLVARLGGDEFAVWLDASDELTVAERAERLRTEGPRILAEALPEGATLITMSVGIASRHGLATEDLDSLMRRADRAMYDVKRNGRGHWRVAHDDYPA